MFRAKIAGNSYDFIVKKKYLTPPFQYSRIQKSEQRKEIRWEKNHGENRRTGFAV